MNEKNAKEVREFGNYLDKKSLMRDWEAKAQGVREMR